MSKRISEWRNPKSAVPWDVVGPVLYDLWVKNYEADDEDVRKMIAGVRELYRLMKHKGRAHAWSVALAVFDLQPGGSGGVREGREGP